ncbi:MAG: L-threonylcarbamoyladenylate synthase [Filifactoraceae bacterium]
MAIILQVENEITDIAGIEMAANALKQGKTVIFPTETVYGLGANALDDQAAKRIYKAKGRPSDNPLIVHIADFEMLEELVMEISDDARTLMNKFWPGPLTLVFKKSQNVPYATTGGLDTVAIRMPANEIARSIIRKSGVPIAAPSANLSGKPSITDVEAALKEMYDRVDIIIVSEKSEIGLESTVVDTTGDVPTILRPGKIGKNQLKEYIKNIEVDEGILKDGFVAKSPGMKYTHYSPEAKVYIVEDKLRLKKISSAMRLEGKAVRILCLDEDMELFSDIGVSLGSDIEDFGKNLFIALRKADDDKIEIIFCPRFTGGDMEDAIMNRLTKAGETI